MVQKVNFACMSEGTAADFQLCATDIERDARSLPDRMTQPMVRSVSTRSPRMVDMTGFSAGHAE